MMKRKGKPENTMSASRSSAPSPEERLLEKKVRSANRALLVEKLWPRIWLPLAVCGVFVLLSAFEVWQLLPPTSLRRLKLERVLPVRVARV